MKIQFLNGGLANQAFQYIFARYYELSHPWDKMYMDDSYFALHTVHNGYELEKVFGIRPHMLSECFTPEVWSFILEEKGKERVFRRFSPKTEPTSICCPRWETPVKALTPLTEKYSLFQPTSTCPIFSICREISITTAIGSIKAGFLRTGKLFLKNFVFLRFRIKGTRLTWNRFYPVILSPSMSGGGTMSPLMWHIVLTNILC